MYLLAGNSKYSKPVLVLHPGKEPSLLPIPPFLYIFYTLCSATHDIPTTNDSQVQVSTQKAKTVFEPRSPLYHLYKSGGFVGCFDWGFLFAWLVWFFLSLPPRTFDLVSLSHCLVFMKWGKHFILSLVFMKNHKNHEALAICRDIYIIKVSPKFYITGKRLNFTNVWVFFKCFYNFRTNFNKLYYNNLTSFCK